MVLPAIVVGKLPSSGFWCSVIVSLTDSGSATPTASSCMASMMTGVSGEVNPNRALWWVSNAVMTWLKVPAGTSNAVSDPW
jgi:hypothetical protein